MAPIAAMSDEGVVLGIAGLTGAREIGRGGFAAVYRAEQPDLHREVAVKVIVAPSLDDAARGRFRRECRAIGRLSGHPNIVAVRQSGFTDGGLPYLIMDFVAGGSLEDQLRLNGPMDWRRVGAIGVKVATTLEYAHGHNVLHRDIKPANILLSQFGEPLLADFGIAWAIDHSVGSVTSSSSGTPAYAPPETWTDQEPQPAGDVYSLGATLHALVTGQPPFVATSGNIFRLIAMVADEPPLDLRTVGVPEAFAAAIEAAMAKEPRSRPQSAGEFAGLLTAALSGAAEPGRVAAVTASPPAAAVRRRLPRRAVALVAALVIVLAAVVVAVALSRKKSSVPPGPARLKEPTGVAIDASGNVYVADVVQARVVKVSPSGAISTFAGGGNRPSGNGDGGPASAAVLNEPTALTFDAAGDLYIVESQDIRRVSAAGIISTVTVKLPGASQGFIEAQGIALSPQGGLAVSTSTEVLHISPDGTPAVLAGSGVANFTGDGGPATMAQLNDPHGLAYGPGGDLFIADSGNNRIRKIGADGTISTVVGPGGNVLGDGGPASQAVLSNPLDVSFDGQGDMLITEYAGDRVRRVDAGSGIIATIAGSAGGVAGLAGDGGRATAALLSGPGAAAAAPNGDVYFSDSANRRLRRISASGTISTVA